MTAAYQINAYQPDAYQTAGIGLPAFQNDAFQFGAFQEAEPIPPEPSQYEGHDAGRAKKALKKLRELEEMRIKAMREDGERRKMLIRLAVDPQARAEYEAATADKGKPVDYSKEIEKIDKQIEKIQNLKQNIALQGIIKVELQNMLVSRAIREQEIRRAIQEADDELALLMMM